MPLFHLSKRRSVDGLQPAPMESASLHGIKHTVTGADDDSGETRTERSDKYFHDALFIIIIASRQEL